MSMEEQVFTVRLCSIEFLNLKSFHPEYIMPPSFNREAHAKVAEAVRKAAIDSGVVRI